MSASPGRLAPDRLLISVVIPTFNRSHQLQQCLEALAKQDLPSACFEVILVDDGGSEPLNHLLAGFKDRLSIRLLHQSHLGCAPARQFGIDHASAEYLAFTDDDCRPATDWLSTLFAALNANPGCAVGGATVNGATDDWFADATQTVVRVLTEWPRDHAGFIPYCPTSNAGFPTAALRNIGGLDPTWSIAGGEDRDLCARWSLAGHRLLYLPAARVFHFHRLNAFAFMKQHFHYGRGAIQFIRSTETNRTTLRPSQRLAFFGALLRAPFHHQPLARAASVAALVALAQIATAAGALTQFCSPATRRASIRLQARS